ncbi:MAG: LysM peptidoglycan-binding domain-containing protein [Deltaproteobacteria bacterium]|nr:LysM peptidoglycan-binding domain-containing protein [Deltaproteobacteria bacterium]
MRAFSVLVSLIFASSLKAQDTTVPPIAKAVVVNQFAGTPPFPGQIRELVHEEAPEEYVVENGDTLFDICDQLIDEPGYWPKLWALNPYIKNPHFIWPGMKVRFFAGDFETPPFLEIVHEEEVIPDKKVSVKIDVDKLFTKRWEPSTILKDLPPEFLDIGDVGSMDISTMGDIYRRDMIKIVLPGFVFPSQPKALGTVSEGVVKREIYGEGEKVRIETPSDLKEGETYTVLRFDKEIEDEEGDLVGYLYRFVAQVHVEYFLDKKKKQAMALIGASRLALEGGDIAVPYLEHEASITPGVGSRSTLEKGARVIAFSDFEVGMGGNNSLVFLDRGTDKGIVKGQIFNIFPDPTIRGWSIEGTFEKIGDLQIIDVSPVGALGYIFSAREEVTIGDFVGKG